MGSVHVNHTGCHHYPVSHDAGRDVTHDTDRLLGRRAGMGRTEDLGLTSRMQLAQEAARHP
jgi:hypothetical protein